MASTCSGWRPESALVRADSETDLANTAAQALELEADRAS
jgi:hypothetical protein